VLLFFLTVFFRIGEEPGSFHCFSSFLLCTSLVITRHVAMKFPECFYCYFYHTCILNSLLTGVTFEVLPLSSYALCPTMLPLLETFLELQLLNSFQGRRHIYWTALISCNFHAFKTNFIFGNSQKLFGAKAGGWVVCSISVIEFWARNCLTENALCAGALSWWRIQSLVQSSGLFLRRASRNSFHISP
jgi:hypothetical protein